MLLVMNNIEKETTESDGIEIIMMSGSMDFQPVKQSFQRRRGYNSRLDQ